MLDWSKSWRINRAFSARLIISTHINLTSCSTRLFLFLPHANNSTLGHQQIFQACDRLSAGTGGALVLALDPFRGEYWKEMVIMPGDPTRTPSAVIFILSLLCDLFGNFLDANGDRIERMVTYACIRLCVTYACSDKLDSAARWLAEG